MKMLRFLTWGSLTPLYSPQLPPFLCISSCIWSSPLPREVCPLGSKVVRLEPPPTTAVPHLGKESVTAMRISGPAGPGAAKQLGWGRARRESTHLRGVSFGGRTSTPRGEVNVAGASASIAGCQLGCLWFGSRNLIRGCCQPRLLPREAETDGVLRGADKKRASCQIEGD